MSLRRANTILGVTLLATASLVAAAPKKDAKKDKAPAPAKDPAPAKGSAAGGGGAGGGSGTATAGGAGSDAAGSAVAPIEDAPPKDMNGTDENPDNPHGVGVETKVEAAAPAVTKPIGYPTEEALRPITLPANMSEISISPHIQVSPAFGSDTLRARYGITPKVQLGLTYLEVGMYNRQQVEMGVPSTYQFKSGKAFGLDVTVLLQNWLAVRVGVPIYVSPLAMSLAIGAPIKFSFGDKVAIGGLDELLNIKLDRFAPRFDQELYNGIAASQTCDTCNRTGQSNGRLRISGYGIYQQSPLLAIIGRIGIDNSLGGGSSGSAGTSSPDATKTFIRAGLQYTVKSFFDLGASVGWDDLATLGSFGPAGYLALRI